MMKKTFLSPVSRPDKSILPRFFSLLLIAVLLFSLLCAPGAAESQRFEAHVISTIAKTGLPFAFELDPDWFDGPSAVYNHAIARLSIGTAMCTYRDTDADENDRDHALREFFQNAGFDTYESYGYDQPPYLHTISNGFAMLRAEDEQGPYTLLAVAVCGMKYGDEWLGNLTIGNGTEHEGFSTAADTVYDRLQQYISDHCAGERIKIWATGFSRAAAVSNLLGDRLLKSGLYDPDSIFIYTFGTPGTTKEPTAWPQIFNICRSFDVVPKVPPREWGFGRNGITMYMPAMETVPGYDESAALAFGQKAFGLDMPSENSNLNFLLGSVLELLLQQIPGADRYTSDYQSAVRAAWEHKGPMLERLEIMIKELEKKEIDTSHLEQILKQITELIGGGLGDTVSSLMGEGGNSAWLSTLSSGIMMFQEHFPELYLSWLYSVDDPALLFDHGNTYRSFAWSGNWKVTITLKDPASGTETVVWDDENGIHNLSVVNLWGRTVASLPAAGEYSLTMTAAEETQSQFGFSIRHVADATEKMVVTNTVTFYPGETVHVHIPAGDHPGIRPVIQMPGDVRLLFRSNASGTGPLTLTASRDGFMGLENTISSILIVIPWLILPILVLIYIAAASIRRFARHTGNDHIDARPIGKILLIITAALCLLLCGNDIVQLIIRSGAARFSLANRTMQRITEYIGIGINAYRVSKILIYLMLSAFCIRSIHHRLSRIRTMRLALTIMVLECFTLFMSLTTRLLTVFDVLVMQLPLLALLSVVLSHVPETGDEQRGKRLIPVLRYVMLTLIIFFIRQIIIYITGITDTAVPVILKALNGLPMVFLTVELSVRFRSFRRQWTMVAVILYFAANAVINLSAIVGTLLFMLGHIALIYCFVKEHKPRLWQVILYAVLSAGLIAELLLTQTPAFELSPALTIPYVLIVIALFTASLPLSRRIRTGTVILLISNQLLVFMWLFPGNFVLESIELLLYYIAIILLSSDTGIPPVEKTGSDAAPALD